MSYSFGPAFKLKNGPNSLSMEAMCTVAPSQLMLFRASTIECPFTHL